MHLRLARVESSTHQQIMKIGVLDTVRGEFFGKLRAGLSGHERPFDRLRANGIKLFRSKEKGECQSDEGAR